MLVVLYLAKPAADKELHLPLNFDRLPTKHIANLFIFAAV